VNFLAVLAYFIDPVIVAWIVYVPDVFFSFGVNGWNCQPFNKPMSGRLPNFQPLRFSFACNGFAFCKSFVFLASFLVKKTLPAAAAAIPKCTVYSLSRKLFTFRCLWAVETNS
jgi:hypothetical protein